MKLIISILLNGILVYFLSWLLGGVTVPDYQTALIAGIVLGIVNWLVKPIVSFIALPLTIITLGLFQLIVNALMVLLASELVGGFEVENIWWGVLFAVLLSILNGILGNQSGKKQTS